MFKFSVQESRFRVLVLCFSPFHVATYRRTLSDRRVVLTCHILIAKDNSVLNEEVLSVMPGLSRRRKFW